MDVFVINVTKYKKLFFNKNGGSDPKATLPPNIGYKN